MVSVAIMEIYLLPFLLGIENKSAKIYMYELSFETNRHARKKRVSTKRVSTTT